MPNPLGAGVCGPPPRPPPMRTAVAPPTAIGPLPARMRLNVQRPELVNAEDHLRLARVWYHLTIGDRVQMLQPGLLHRVVRIPGGLPGLYPLKRDVLGTKQLP